MTTMDPLFEELRLYYLLGPEERLNRFLSIANGESRISLRLINHFLWNYAETHHEKIYDDLKDMLKLYKRERFDLFCRVKGVKFFYGKERPLETTMGQMNIFRWIFNNRILHLIEKNYNEIVNSMSIYLRSSN
jgi:hypothetical protein